MKKNIKRTTVQNKSEGGLMLANYQYQTKK